MTFLKQDEVERMRRQYPPNTKIKCIHMSVDRHPVPDGTLGTVQFVDDAGTIHVGWENGSSLGLVHGEYQFTKVKKREYETMNTHIFLYFLHGFITRNGAAICGKEFGYIVWGINDSTKEITGTSISFDKDISDEPYKHYLARNLKPSITFETAEIIYQGKRIVMLIIPAAKSVKTLFKSEAYIRISSSKERLSKYPEWEIKLNNILVNGIPTIVNTPAPDYAQELTFNKLFVYYASKGINLRSNTFEKTLRLKTKNNEYNIMAYILSDQNEIPLRVSVFTGTDKASPLFSVKEFGNTCILYSMEKILEYGDAINIMQADERNRQSDRKEVPLFDLDVFREAIVNAFVHNKWLILNSPSITIFTDRMEILSHGGLAIDQDEIGFFNGSSIPVNESLASIFLQLRISERSGRGVPKIVSKYGKQAIKIEKNTRVKYQNTKKTILGQEQLKNL